MLVLITYDVNTETPAGRKRLRLSLIHIFAAWLHDVGKYSDAFQLRLKGGPKVDHSTAGAQEAWVRQHLHTAFAVAGHHSGLPDGGSPADDPGDATLSVSYTHLSL